MTAASPTRGSPQRGPPPPAPVVLLVEDNDLLMRTIGMMLENLGYRVKTARTARQGLQVLEQSDTIDLVLSDIVMPGEMNGLDLAVTVREQAPEIPVVLMSAFANAFDDAVAKGFEILPKPFEIETLQSLLRERLATAGRMS